ncbi:MAG: hypothetical protein LBG79_00605 [Spirochaetaceae bacterium]|nr:hypothetical protein [Spirochaetaceae bacterium]
MLCVQSIPPLSPNAATAGPERRTSQSAAPSTPPAQAIEAEFASEAKQIGAESAFFAGWN